MNTPTPRTDAATALTSQHRHDDSFGDPEFGWVTAGFARTLERELAVERARVTTLRSALIAAFEHTGREINRMSLNESAESGTQRISHEIAKALDAAMKEGA